MVLGVSAIVTWDVWKRSKGDASHPPIIHVGGPVDDRFPNRAVNRSLYHQSLLS